MPRRAKAPPDPLSLEPQDLDDAAAGIAEYLRQIAPMAVLQSMQTSADLRAYADDPIGFAKDILGINFWMKQEEVASELRRFPLLVVEAGHSVGKSFSAAALGAHHLSCKEPAILVTTAPTMHQVNDILWQQMRAMKATAKIPLPGDIYKEARWAIGPRRFGVGLSPRKGSNEEVAAFQGLHDKNLLVILDEAAGLTKYMFEAAVSLCTDPNNRLLAIGNPTSESGPFYEATKSSAWRHVRISCLDHPNVVTGRTIIDGAVSLQWVEARIKDWCRPVETPNPKSFMWKGRWYDPSPVFQARVLGVPPSERHDQLIPLAWVIAAQGRYVENPLGERIMGLDVARSGEDESSLVFRIDDNVRWVQRSRISDTMDIVNWLQNCMREEGVTKAYIDENGVGSGVLDRAHQLDLPVVGVMPQRNAIQKNRFHYLRDEMWWTVREKLRTGEMSLPDDDMLAADLTAPCWGSNKGDGRTEIDEKDKTRKMLGRSPDSGDALAYSYMGTMMGGSGTNESYVDELKSDSRWGAGGSRWSIGGERKVNRWRIR